MQESLQLIHTSRLYSTKYYRDPGRDNFPIGNNPDGNLKLPITSRDLQNHFDATTGFTCSYSGFFQSPLLCSRKSAVPCAASLP